MHGIGRFSSALLARLPEFQRIELGGRPSSPGDPWRLGAYLRRVRPTLYFSPGYNVPVNAQCSFAITIHDLNHLHVRENSSALKRLYYSRILRPAAQRACAIFTVSEFSRQQILEWSGLEDDRVICVRQGIADDFSEKGEVYESMRPYLLYVGNHRPHKNLRRVLSAFAVSGLGGELDLLATGIPTKELAALVNGLGLDERVRFLGDVSDRALAALYRGATALVLVSLYEGFGLPIIESMACGAPVLTSAVASMPEVSGGAAVLVDPLDVDAIAAGMRKIALDEDLRGSLRIRGMAWSAHYRWDLTARAVRDGLRRCER